MKCPVDDTQLAISERQGVEIDYCPQCRGVWLDRGELDKLIERSSQYQTVQQKEAPRNRYNEANRSTSNEQYYDKHSKPKKKKESFLSDMFDF